MPTHQLQIDPVVSLPFMENTWIVRRADLAECAVVDPGLQPEKIVAFVERQRLTVTHLLITHGHADHIGGNQALKARWPAAEIVIGAGDAPMLTDPVANLSGLAGLPITSPPADRLVREGDRLTVSGVAWEVLDIPGHSPGHVVYLTRETRPFVVLGGDVLFEGGVGRWDFPGGNQRQLMTGIREKLFRLPEDTLVYPGHGEPTTVGREKWTNPFCGMTS